VDANDPRSGPREKIAAQMDKATVCILQPNLPAGAEGEVEQGPDLVVKRGTRGSEVPLLML